MRRLALAILVTAAVAAVQAPVGAAGRASAAIVFSGPLSLVSTTADGTKGGGLSQAPSISATGTVLAFHSLSTNLDAGDSDVASDVYLKDLTTGALTLASTSDDGTKGNADSFAPSLDNDGSTVAFLSDATNLDPADTDPGQDIYVKDAATGDLVLASSDDNGVRANDISFLHSLSGTGTSVTFASNATNLDPLDTDPVRDVYMKDATTGDIQLVSQTAAGVKGNGEGTSPSINADGTRVAFSSTSTNFSSKDTDVSGDAYVKVLSTGKLILVTKNENGVKQNGFSLAPSIAGAGKKVAFASDSTNLDPGDVDSIQDIYVKTIPTGDIQLASTSDAGVKSNDVSADPVISRSGKRVAFISKATNLDPDDTSSDWDVYVKNLVTGNLQLVTTTAAGVHGNGTNHPAVAISGAGRFTAFDSNATNLEPNDTDARLDVYVKDSTTCTAVGTSGNDTLVGGVGGDVLCGEGGNDTLDGVGGDDVLFGGSGADTLQGGPGADAIHGNDGSDTLDYEDSGDSVVVDLSTHAASGGDADGDTFDNSESVQGSELPDALTGDAATNGLIGLGGEDVLAGEGGADLLLGGDEVDVLDYRTSPTAVTVDLFNGIVSGGDAEGDAILGFEGAFGSAFDDTLLGDTQDNFFLGMGGADTIGGGAGIDLANYAYSPLGVTVNLTNGVTNNGDAEGDTLMGIENLAGSAFDDTLTGDDDPNTLFGGDGADTLSGKGADDTLFGQADTDTFDGGGATDTCDNVAGESATSCEL